MFTFSSRFILASAAVALSALPLAADVPTLPPPASTIAPPQVQSDEQRFLAEIYRFCSLERQMGELALQKSSRIPVQEYARRTIDTQSRRQRELEFLARDVHIALPAPGRGDQETLDRLALWQGEAFNRAYLNATIANHEAAIAALQIQSQGNASGNSLAPVAQWAARHMDEFNDELTRAQTIAQSLGVAQASEPGL